MPERIATAAALGALLSGCGQGAVPGNAAAAADAAAPAPERPERAAERLVRQRIGGGALRFEESRAYRHGDVAVVCGAYAQPGRAHQRFVAVSDVDVWLEPEMAPGQMDRAFAEYCRDGAANA
ncbi:MAG TPA: hypothetical protein VF603_04075 [Allosphingosinicella sp.]